MNKIIKLHQNLLTNNEELLKTQHSTRKLESTQSQAMISLRYLYIYIAIRNLIEKKVYMCVCLCVYLFAPAYVCVISADIYIYIIYNRYTIPSRGLSTLAKK